MQAVTTATVQFAVNYVPQCFYANDPYSVLSRFIIIKSMVYPLLQNVMTHRYSVENPIFPDPCCHFEPILSFCGVCMNLSMSLTITLHTS